MSLSGTVRTRKPATGWYQRQVKAHQHPAKLQRTNQEAKQNSKLIQISSIQPRWRCGRCGVGLKFKPSLRGIPCDCTVNYLWKKTTLTHIYLLKLDFVYPLKVQQWILKKDRKVSQHVMKGGLMHRDQQESTKATAICSNPQEKEKKESVKRKKEEKIKDWTSASCFSLFLVLNRGAGEGF